MNNSQAYKILIVGSNGMLGKDIVDVLRQSDKFEVFGLNRKYDDKLDEKHSIICDITNKYEVNNLLEYINPKIIINCVANVSVENCEKDKEETYKLHVEATENLARFNSEITKYIYISTDSVFDGIDGNYKEIDKTNPLNYYAFTKLEGEKQALKYNKNTLVIRTNIYGFHKSKSNSIVEWALGFLENNKPISGFKDVIFNPIYTKQLARIILELINIDYCGVLNVASNEVVSKYTFLVKLANKFNIDSKLINSISVEDIAFNAKRPKNTSLNLNKFNDVLSYKISIEDGLNEMYMDLLNKKEGINL